MASEAQINYVTDLAVQTGVLPVTHIEVCRAEVATWTHQEVTFAISYLKSRLWRSRARATTKQIEYGNQLLAEISTHMGAEPEDLDFELMNSLQATDELTRLESLLAFLRDLDAEPDMWAEDEPVEPQPGAQPRLLPDLADVFRQMAQQGGAR